MNITVIGCGYVGLVTGVTLAKDEFTVVCVDKDFNTINKLKNGEIPFYEPGLREQLNETMNDNKISFINDIKRAIAFADIIYIAVGTPSSDDGSADMKDYYSVIRTVGEMAKCYKLIINKSTVPIGTAYEARRLLRDILEKRQTDFDIDVVSNPEFLREGNAILDSLKPERIVVGCMNEKSKMIMEEIMKPKKQKGIPIIYTDIHSAELIKYASNSFLAMKLTFMNELSELCEKVGANIGDIEKGIGFDSRIGKQFLSAGPGYGGSCFPKDTLALSKSATELDVKLNLVEATIYANHSHFERIYLKAVKLIESMKEPVIGVLGLSFKANTSDIRNSLSIKLITRLLENNYEVKAYDPKVKYVKSLQAYKGFNIKATVTEALKDANIIFVMTEWDEFRSIDYSSVSYGEGCIMLDYRNLYSKLDIERCEIKYYGIGNC